MIIENTISTNNNVIFCDFDGTIIKEDSVDKLLEMHANDDWIFFENLWLENKMGSRDCLEKQINCISHFTDEDLEEFIRDINIDEHFLIFLQEIKRFNLDLYILSDGFDLLINKILDKYRINNVKVFSNVLYLVNNSLKPLFPFHNYKCKAGAGLCKCSILKRMARDRKVIYIGDGKSDFCVSQQADIIFAKNKLADYCRDNNRHFFEFNDFSDIKLSSLIEEDINLVRNKIIK